MQPPNAAPSVPAGPTSAPASFDPIAEMEDKRNRKEKREKQLENLKSNRLSKRMKEEGYNDKNTNGDDLDLFPINHKTENFDAITAFEILEHLISPFQLLKNIKCKRLYATVPLSLWYSKAYRNYNDIRDSHFHEFEDWQFDWLLQKSGWKIIRKEKWINPSFVPGIRTILRNFSKRYYAIEAVKK